MEITALKMEDACAQAGCQFAHGAVVAMLMAGGVARHQRSPSMGHAVHVAGVHRYYGGPPSLPSLSQGGEGSRAFRATSPPHPAPSLLQEDLGWGVCSQCIVLPLAWSWESGDGFRGAGVTL